MQLKPTKRKVLYSLLGTLVWYGALIIGTAFGTVCKCATGGFEGCVDYYHTFPIPLGCHCSCTTLSIVIIMYLFAFVLPFVASYLWISLKGEESKKRWVFIIFAVIAVVAGAMIL